MRTAAEPVRDIATLRAICHSCKVTQDSRPWYVLQRRISIYLTWVLVRTGLAPNHVTLISVGLALLGGILLAMRPTELAIAGAFAFLAHHLFDKADGDIARFQKNYSIVGVYLDELGHGLAFGGIFLGLGLHLAWRTPRIETIMLLLLASALGALAMVLGRLHKSVGFLLYAQYALTQPELLPQGSAKGRWNALSRDAVHRSRKSNSARGGLLAAVRDAALQLSDISVMLLLVLVGTILEAATGSDLFLKGVLYAEAALQCAVFVTVVAVNAAVNVECEVARLDALVSERAGSEERR